MYSLFLLVILQACDSLVNSTFTCCTVEFAKSPAAWQLSVTPGAHPQSTVGHTLLAQILQPGMVLSAFIVLV